MFRVGFDIGGTFTDFVAQDLGDGELTFWKTLSMPSRPAEGVLRGLDELLDHLGRSLEEVDEVVHATTVAANAVIERKGVPTGLITTRGFRDVLLIGRQKRYETYDLFLDKPRPLVPRRLVLEVDERIAHDGEVLESLEPSSVDRAVQALVAEGVESIAVVLLHSYSYPDHEQFVRDRVRELAPEVSVSLSSEVSPKYREYERTSTTVANAYIRPIVDQYLNKLGTSLSERGYDRRFFIMQSNGGLATPPVVRKYPVRIVESGPAAGVLMAAQIGQEENSNSVLTFDMGGTTAKLGAIDAGQPAVSPTFEVDAIRYRKGSGLPLNIPAVELLEIGAGGGSIAGTGLGLVQVGPESAGSEPGPICYGLGGDRATVTDANLVLGYLNPSYFNAGRMTLDAAAAEVGVDEQIAGPLGLSVGEAAWGIHAVANSNMERAMRVVSLERGRDPSRYLLVAFGGAGPLHAARLARALGIPRVVVPRGAGVGSAVGLLTADAKFDVSLTRVLALDGGNSDEIAAVYEELEAKVTREVGDLLDLGRPQWSRYAYMRYTGQGYELKVDLPTGEICEDYAAKVAPVFHEAYRRNYGYAQTDAPIEGVDWYLVVTFPGSDETAARNGRSGITDATGPKKLHKQPRKAYFPETDGYATCEVLDRYGMVPGQRFTGPAVIEERESTTVVPPDDTARISEAGHLVVEIGGGE